MNRLPFALLLLPLAVTARADDRVEHGRYLTHNVAMCVECHTPRTDDGTLIRDEEFMGAPFPVGAPTFIGDKKWCVRAPRIAGLPGWKEADAVQFLMNGSRFALRQPGLPMPRFHMNREDAEAVVAYLKSLGGEPGSGGATRSGRGQAAQPEGQRNEEAQPDAGRPAGEQPDAGGGAQP